MVQYLFVILGLVSALLGVGGRVWAQEQVSTAQDQTALNITIYNENLALIKDQRRISIKEGDSVLAWRDVSGKIRPETALLKRIASSTSSTSSASSSALGTSGPSGSGDSLSVYEQNFDYDLLSPSKLVEKYLGKTVFLRSVNPSTGNETQEAGLVLATNEGVVLKLKDRIETVNGNIASQRLVFPDVPADLRDQPTLTLGLNSSHRAISTVELNYLSGGISWAADYVAQLNAADKQIDLSAWVTLKNVSGVAYRNARLQLVAGDVNQVVTRQPQVLMMARAAPDRSVEVTSENLSDYHLYTLPRLTSVANNQTKQVALMSATKVPVKKELVFEGFDYQYSQPANIIARKQKASIILSFDNKKTASLGVALPKGVMRVYKKDQGQNLQFIGEDQIDHTAVNEVVNLHLGQSFDVSADKVQTDFSQTASNKKNQFIYQSAYEITLKNGKNEVQEVLVNEPISGVWSVLKESHKSERVGNRALRWKISIPAESSVVLKYRVQVER